MLWLNRKPNQPWRRITKYFWEIFSMTTKVTPFLMFEEKAEEAMGLYVSLIPDSRITNIVRYGEGQAGKTGSVMRADFVLAGQPVICIDSPVPHAFTFTASFSMFVDCVDE